MQARGVPRRGPRLSDGEYRRRYEREVNAYVSRFTPKQDRPGVGADRLSAGVWAWVDDGLAAAARWARYARGHGRLRVMNPDGTWRAWEPRGVQ
jgi:hypothetical protein